MATAQLIERDVFLAAIDDEFKKATSGEGHSLFITGEAGIGKTSLVRTFLKNAGDKCIAYTGACDALFTPRPLAPLYDLAVQLKDNLTGEIHSMSSMAELFAHFASALSGRDKPIVLVFEDIHWADEATFDFIKFFARRITRTKCLFILTYRADEINQEHPLRNVLGELAPDTFRRIQLTSLSREAVQIMADEKGYNGEDVYNISGGNPFYVNEILASYSQGIPDNIKDAVLSVYYRLSDITRAVWQLLSVIPEGFEVRYAVKINSEYNNAISNCLEKKILVIKDEKLFFKHELYRRTIENSLSPFKRVELNKFFLRNFIADFENAGEIERIVHHAKNANENELVIKYALLAAAKAALVGSHVEASKLYLTAIEFSSENNNNAELVSLYEAYAYECYLINHVREAIIFQGKALNIWREQGNAEQEGNSLRFLSRLWWFDGNGKKAEKYGNRAIEVLEPLPASRIKAMALSNMSQLKMLADESQDAIAWGNKAISMATELNDNEILSHALNNVGTVQSRTPRTYENGKTLLLKSLEIALKNSYHEHAARAYTNIIANSVNINDFGLAKKYLEEGITYCEQRDLDTWLKHKLSFKAWMLLKTGDWDNAMIIACDLIKDERQTDIVKITALVILGIIKVRRGEDGAVEMLTEAKQMAFTPGEHQRIMPVMIACLEYEWLTGESAIIANDLKTIFHLLKNFDDIYQNSECVFRLQKANRQSFILPVLYEPYMHFAEGNFTKAAEFWRTKGCPYEEALALFEGREDDKRKAVSLVQKLGANAVLEKMKLEMRSSGIRKIPRGLRKSTKNNPVQLTNRELDVLQLLKKGAQNKEIAGTLFISPKTVDHHISSILFKLDVKARVKAVHEAIRLGILK